MRSVLFSIPSFAADTDTCRLTGLAADGGVMVRAEALAALASTSRSPRMRPLSVNSRDLNHRLHAVIVAAA
jgi:hypothetical protein